MARGPQFPQARARAEGRFSRSCSRGSPASPARAVSSENPDVALSVQNLRVLKRRPPVLVLFLGGPGPRGRHHLPPRVLPRASFAPGLSEAGPGPQIGAPRCSDCFLGDSFQSTPESAPLRRLPRLEIRIHPSSLHELSLCCRHCFVLPKIGVH